MTSKVRSVWQAGSDLAVFGNDVNNSFLDEVHLGSHCALFDDIVSWLEDLILQLRDDVRDKIRISVREERNSGHECSAVEVDDFLSQRIATFATIEPKNIHNGECRKWIVQWKERAGWPLTLKYLQLWHPELPVLKRIANLRLIFASSTENFSLITIKRRFFDHPHWNIGFSCTLLSVRTRFTKSSCHSTLLQGACATHGFWLLSIERRPEHVINWKLPQI